MHRRWQNFLIVILLVLVGPCLMMAKQSEKSIQDLSQTEDSAQTHLTESDDQTEEIEKIDGQISVLHDDGTIKIMNIEEYVLCVVLAEMPASFETEALKAQAVVARTYTLRRLGGNHKHPDATVCTRSSCCQGYCSESECSDNDVDKVRRAVSDTEGIVLAYQGQLIEATYFSCSGGITEDAAAVWGEDVPYLQSTLSPGEEHAASFVNTVYLTVAEFERSLGTDLTGNPKNWIGKIAYTAGQGVDTIEIGGVKYDGTQLRSMLGLRSTVFTITVVDDTVAITTSGYGHRVGMSQYGADAMAVNGSSYSQILSHYYKGVEIVKFEQLGLSNGR